MYKQKCLYSILGLAKNCTTKDIRRSYRILALKYHPDKQEKENKEITEKFHEVQHAYSILRDANKRKKYDKTGSTERSSSEYVNIEAEDIEAFAKTYPGSEEEKVDLKELFENHEGDVSSLYEYIPLSEPSSESLDRYLARYDEMFKTGELTSNKCFEHARKRLIKNLNKSIQRMAKERKQFENQKESISDLVAAIEANKKRRMDEGAKFLLSLENKPSRPRKKSKRS
eukprot:Gregarina_sp_Poly_1__8740@NODE_522_length_7737_cov_43_131421_g404_i2_p2_GENE_NODE_522_length_7737_cov_43_131421_g404_i2NODE_522_length_7737_cov_43_131421_g404_i2_p2_ORF_typecomplete_len228_score44_65DnaJ/PF00226_31/5_1e22DUF592/PF04574_13/2_4e02DUF592/PF04574_13/0_1SMBP/PF16785_5/8_9e02SMBP/PF16785_5/0_29SPAM/PF02090_15/35SPAM/PF02090_15/0_43Noelin1/PF12308_8/1_4e02Noelin1/PF12308_8/1_8SHE3/PF17078_5/21SHE3/PF17078_5/1_9Glyco_hydro_4C/PF11975_8/6_4AAA_15/PF13175_6/5_9TTKRSYEDQ/PF10212_9/6_6TTKRS